MISPVSQPPANTYASNQTTPPSAPPQKPQQKEDTVQLSDAAKAASGDADHDGDSH